MHRRCPSRVSFRRCRTPNTTTLTPHATFPRLPQHLRFSSRSQRLIAFIYYRTSTPQCASPYALSPTSHWSSSPSSCLAPPCLPLSSPASASTADRCKYIQPTTRYALDKAGADRPCLWHSANEGYGPMDREACQEKCASTEHPERCVGFTQPTDGV